MAKKQNITPNGTYVFDPAEIDHLDDLSMTAVLSDVVNANTPEAPEADAPELVGPTRLGDTTINELLSGQLEPDDAPPSNSGLRPESAETLDDIQPELLFPDLTTSKGGKRR